MSSPRSVRNSSGRFSAIVRPVSTCPSPVWFSSVPPGVPAPLVVCSTSTRIFFSLPEFSGCIAILVSSKMTSLLMISFEGESNLHNLYPLTPLAYPRKIHLAARESSLSPLT
ncbi:hypothetical protein V8G54_001817 [Vigna mungo]|uniref:Uncharacterized protein n=1 Tax=Vigna mungo TaxID=3915 RepID=A0AAQ3PB38_VIGMU